MIREKYVDIRLGWSIISPVIGFINFIMLIYITVKSNITINEILPVQLSIPVIIILLIITIVITGTLFRKKQLKIDSTLNYEQQIEPAKTTRILFDDLHIIQRQLGLQIRQESINRRQYMLDIESGKFG